MDYVRAQSVLNLVCFVVVLGFYVPPTAKVIWRRDLGLKSHPKDWRSPGSNSGPLVYKAGSLTARPRRFLVYFVQFPSVLFGLNDTWFFMLMFSVF